MKKHIIAFLASVLTALPVMAQVNKEIQLHMPQKAGGGSAAQATILAKELGERGWKVDFKMIGNCAQVRDQVLNSKKPLLTQWENEYHLDAKNPCFLSERPNQFLSLANVSHWYMCGRVGGEQPKKHGIYTVAKQYSAPDEAFLKKLGTTLGVEFRMIHYSNQGDIRKAWEAKEIDLVYSAMGNVLENEGRASCFYTTHPRPANKAVPFTKVIDSPAANKAVVLYWTVNDAMDPAIKAALQKDVQEIVRGPAYTKWMADAKRETKFFSDPLASQLEIFSQSLKAMRP